jgi:hypothetical protein
MAIFTVHSTLKFPDGQGRYFYIETPHSSLGELIADLRQGPVICTKLRATYDRDSNKMLVSERGEFAFTQDLVRSLEPQHLPFVDAEGV